MPLSTGLFPAWFLWVIVGVFAAGTLVHLVGLSSCQRLALFTIIRSYRTSSTDALCVLTGVPLLHISLRCKLMENDVIKGDGQVITDDIQIKSDNIMKMLINQNYMHYFGLKDLYFVKSVVDVNTVSAYPIIFTDGSKMDIGTSMGFTVFYGNT